MGFRIAHIDEALEYCSDMAMALDWLCKWICIIVGTVDTNLPQLII